MRDLFNPDGTLYGFDLSDEIPEAEKQITRDWLIKGKYPASLGGQGFMMPVGNYSSCDGGLLDYVAANRRRESDLYMRHFLGASYQTIGGNWEKYSFSVDRVMARRSMFVKEVVIEQDNGPTLLATGLLANSMSRGRLFGKGHIVSWAATKAEQEKILYYTGADYSHYPNIGTIGHCDWSPYRMEGLYEPLSPLREAIRRANSRST